MHKRNLLGMFALAGIGALTLEGVSRALNRAQLQSETDQAALGGLRPQIAAEDDNKLAAIEQVKGLLPDDFDSTVTRRFAELSQKYPWLRTARQSAGMFNTGSMGILDKFGTVILTQHEQSQFPPFFKLPFKDRTVETPILDFKKDPKHDIMFGTISPAFIKNNKLIPVSLGKFGFTDNEKGRKIVYLGWPALNHRLHAVEATILAHLSYIEGQAYSRDPSAATQHYKAYCKMAANGALLPGMSGGIAFDDHGKMIGINNASNSEIGTNAEGYFTPIDLIINAYCELYPDRAARSGVMAIPTNNSTPDYCRVGRRDFAANLLSRLSAG